MEAIADHEAAMIVQEGDQVDATILPLEDEGKEIGLPKLVGTGTLEAADPIGMRTGRDFFKLVTRFVEDPGHGLRAGGQGRPAEEHVADALAAPVGIGLFEHEDGALGQVIEPAPLGSTSGLVQEAGGALGLKAPLPDIEGVLGDADQGGEITGREVAPLPDVQK
jgi:hypothetical protein